MIPLIIAGFLSIIVLMLVLFYNLTRGKESKKV